MKKIFQKTFILAFQKTLILAFEVIVQIPEYTYGEKSETKIKKITYSAEYNFFSIQILVLLMNALLLLSVIDFCIPKTNTKIHLE